METWKCEKLVFYSTGKEILSLSNDTIQSQLSTYYTTPSYIISLKLILYINLLSVAVSSKRPTTLPYPEPAECTLHHTLMLYLYNINYIC